MVVGLWQWACGVEPLAHLSSPSGCVRMLETAGVSHTVCEEGGGRREEGRWGCTDGVCLQLNMAVDLCISSGCVRMLETAGISHTVCEEGGGRRGGVLRMCLQLNMAMDLCISSGCVRMLRLQWSHTLCEEGGEGVY